MLKKLVDYAVKCYKSFYQAYRLITLYKENAQFINEHRKRFGLLALWVLNEYNNTTKHPSYNLWFFNYIHQDNHISNLWKVPVFHLATKVTSIPKFHITVPILSWIFTLAKYSFMEELIQKSGHMAIITKNMEQLITEMPSNFHMCTGWQNLPRCQLKGINTIFPLKMFALT